MKNSIMENSNALRKVKNIETNSFTRMRHRELVRLLMSVNEENKYWEPKKEKRIRPVPNLSGRCYNPDDTYDVVKDYFTEGKFDPSFQKLILATASKDRIVLYVHQDEFGFAPIFAVLESSQNFLNSKSKCLIKFVKRNFSSENFSEFTRLLYSKENKNKLSRIKKNIKELSSYDY